MSPERLAAFRKTFGPMSTEELRAILERQIAHKLSEEALEAIAILLRERNEPWQTVDRLPESNPPQHKKPASLRPGSAPQKDNKLPGGIAFAVFMVVGGIVAWYFAGWPYIPLGVIFGMMVPLVFSKQFLRDMLGYTSQTSSEDTEPATHPPAVDNYSIHLWIKSSNVDTAFLMALLLRIRKERPQEMSQEIRDMLDHKAPYREIQFEKTYDHRKGETLVKCTFLR